MSAPVSHLPDPRDRHGLAAALEAVVVDAVRSCLADHAALELPASRGRRMVKRSEAAKYLSVSMALVDEWARKGLITRYRFGGVVRFDVAELDRFADGWERS